MYLPTYIASYRQVLMKERLEAHFQEITVCYRISRKMGIQINWQELLTKEETYFIVVIISLVLLFFFGCYLLKCLARENKDILERK